MRIALAELEFDIKGSGNKATFHPTYLKADERNKVHAFVQFLEQNLSKKKSDIDFEALDDLFPSYKIVRSLQVSCLRYYSFLSLTYKDVFQEPKSEGKKPTDITSFIKEKTSTSLSIINMDVTQFRELVYNRINSECNGFVSTPEREQIIDTLEKEIGIPNNSLETLLYLDLDSEKVLTKTEEIDAVNLIRYHNYDVVETALSFSIDLQLRLKSLPGYLAKKLVYLSKKNYVFSDIVLEDDGYRITILPPLEMFREKGGWGRNMANVATYILRVLLREEIPFQLNAIVEPRKRKALFHLDSKNLPLLPTFRSKEENMVFRPAIDSKVEDQFLKSWRNYHGWKAVPEPEAIIVGKKMYVPDFILKRGDKVIYLEIVGFYTSKYIQKKKNQMVELKKIGVPIIYLIDENIQPNFVDLRGIEMLTYSGTKIPNQDLVRLLEREYSDFEDRLPKFKKTFSQICQTIAEEKSFLTLQRLNEELQTYSDNETTKFMESEDAIGILKNHKVILLPSFGLISNSIVQTVEEFMTKAKKIPLSTLKEQFPNYKDALIAICQNIGCSVKWKSIDEVEIVL